MTTPTPTPIRIISSMATKALLADLARLFEAQSPECAVQIESVGGVDAAKRVQAGEAFDCVVLASNAIDTLMQGGKLLPGSRVDLVYSSVAVAVPAGAPCPDISSEAALKLAVLQASSIGYSTGPSGVELLKQFERWGITAQVQDKLMQAQPGIPVGALLAQGQVALGFQQLSEMMGVQGITVLGPLPDAVQVTTTFSGAVSATCTQAQAVQALLNFWASASTAQAKVKHGMQVPAQGTAQA
jgi:molybdate transport system substrate-binding protein